MSHDANVGSDDPVLGNIQPERNRLIGGQRPTGGKRPLEVGWGHDPACTIERLLKAEERTTRAASDLPAEPISRGREARAALWFSRSKTSVASVSSVIASPI